MNFSEIKIGFLGDSITQGAGASTREKCYVSKVMELTGAKCCNYGIGGTRIARQKKASENPVCDADFCSRVAEMEPDLDMVVVFGGTNDFGHGDAPIGDFNDRTPYTFYGALHTLYTSLVEKYPDSPIVVITPLHRVQEEREKNGEIITLKQYVDVIREVAEYYSLPVIDLFANSGLQPKIPVIKEKFMADGLHPTDKGHKLLAEKIVLYLKQNIF